MYDNLTDQQLTDLRFDLSFRLNSCNRQLNLYVLGVKRETKGGWLYRLHSTIVSLNNSLAVANSEAQRRENRFYEVLLELFEKRAEQEDFDLLVLEARAICDGVVH